MTKRAMQHPEKYIELNPIVTRFVKFRAWISISAVFGAYCLIFYLLSVDVIFLAIPLFMCVFTTIAVDFFLDFKTFEYSLSPQ